MPTTPAISARITITAKDINGNNVAKTFNNVGYLHYDYIKGTLNIVDQDQGSFFFSLLDVTTVTYTVVSGVGGATTVVMS